MRPNRMTLALLVILATISSARAQDLLIEYDFESRDIAMFELDDGWKKKREEPRVGFNRRVIVRVKNINQNVFAVNATSPAGIIAIDAGRPDLTALLGTIRAPVTGMPASTEPPLPDPERAYRSYSITRGTRGNPNSVVVRYELPTPTAEVRSAVQLLLRELESRRNPFYEAIATFTATVDRRLQGAAPIQELLESVAVDRTSSEKGVKERATSVMRAMIPSPPASGSVYTVKEIIDDAQARYAEIGEAKSTLDDRYRELLETFEKLETLHDAHPGAIGMEISSGDGRRTLVPLEEWVEKRTIEDARMQYAAASRLFDSVQTRWMPYFRIVADTYVAIQASSFTYQYETAASGDEVDVDLRIYERAPGSTIRADEALLVDARELTVPVSGGIRIDAGIGLGLAHFFNNQSTFGIVADTIARVTVDRITPLVAAFLHVYPRAAGELTFGGTLGVGISMLETKGFNVLVGGSAIVGRSERIVLTAGMTLGEVPRLADGQFIGARLAPGTRIATDTGFDFGAFFAVSYGFTE